MDSARDQTSNELEQEAADRRRELAPSCALALNWAFVVFFYRQPRDASRSRTPTFLAQVQAGNVATVTAQDAAIQGTLKHAIRYPAREEREAGDGFSTRVPDFADTKALDTLLQEKGVVVTAKAPRDSVVGDAARRLRPDAPVLRPLVRDHAAVGHRQHVLLRKLEGQEVRADE